MKVGFRVHVRKGTDLKTGSPVRGWVELHGGSTISREGGLITTTVQVEPWTLTLLVK